MTYITGIIPHRELNHIFDRIYRMNNREPQRPDTEKDLKIRRKGESGNTWIA